MKQNLFLQRAGQIAGVGGWRVDLRTQLAEWSDRTCTILDAPTGYQPTLTEALNLYLPDAKVSASVLIDTAISDGESWDFESLVTTLTGRKISIRSVGEITYSGGKAIALEGAILDITQHRAEESQRQEMLEEAKHFYDEAPCGYYSIDADKTFVRINDRLLSWLGCARQDLIGKRKVTDFMTLESRQKVEATFVDFVQRGEVHDLECELLPIDGKSRFVAVSATAVYDDAGAFLQSRSVMYDITQRVEFREQAKALANEQQAMLNNDLIGTIRLSNRQIIWANRAMHRIFGYDDGELIGQSARTAYRDDESFEALGAAAYPRLQAGESYRTELEMVRRDGTPIWISMHGMQLPDRPTESMWMMVDITALKLHEAQVQHVANHDPLTGLPNRRLLSDRIDQALALAQRQGTYVALCYIDLDGFKAVNDQHGHTAGDKLLIEMATRLTACVRAADTVSRMGGDEFVVLLTGLTGVGEFEHAIQRVLRTVAEPIVLGGATISTVSASIGVSLYPEDATEKGLLFRQADQAMYRAKELGKNQFHRLPVVHDSVPLRRVMA